MKTDELARLERALGDSDALRKALAEELQQSDVKLRAELQRVREQRDGDLSCDEEFMTLLPLR